MTLKDLGEFSLIKKIDQKFSPLLPRGVTGIGDDCAVVRLNNRISELISTDMLIETVHFLPGLQNAYDLGYKSLAVNLSDLAAMGGEPTGAYLSLGIPPEREVGWIDEFFEGFYALAAETKTPLLGGDTTRSPNHFVISVTIVGRAETRHIKYRHSARPGDLVCVTDNLGNSAAGLSILKKHNPLLEKQYSRLVMSHLRPGAQIKEGNWLARQNSVHAMMDISDGLASDIRRIMERSRVGARINIDQLPVSADLRRYCRANKLEPSDFALKGGEDYCLLVTIAADGARSLQQQFREEFKRQLFCIGEIFEGNELLSVHGKEINPLTAGGFDHFKS